MSQNAFEQAKWQETLDRAQGPEILALLQDDRVTDVVINPNGSVWVERVGEVWERTNIHFEAPRALTLVRALAAIDGAEVHERKPILEARMPREGLRVEALVPPCVRAPAIAIRKPARVFYSLESYVESGRMPREVKDVLDDAIRARLNILIAGSTGSGKSTFGMALMQGMGELMPHDRVYLIEDMEELEGALNTFIPNCVPTKSSEVLSMDELLTAALRMIPTRIVVGEVRDKAALIFLKALASGHEGGFATIHAGNCRDALHRLASLAAEGTLGYVPREEVCRAIQMVIFLARRASGRGVEQIVRVRGLSNGEYDCEEIYDRRSNRS